MNLYLVDDTQENVDPDFDAALFVYADNPTHAARLWEDCYERGATEARVTLVPLSHPPFYKERVVEWRHLRQDIVKLA